MAYDGAMTNSIATSLRNLFASKAPATPGLTHEVVIFGSTYPGGQVLLRSSKAACEDFVATDTPTDYYDKLKIRKARKTPVAAR